MSSTQRGESQIIWQLLVFPTLVKPKIATASGKMSNSAMSPASMVLKKS